MLLVIPGAQGKRKRPSLTKNNISVTFSAFALNSRKTSNLENLPFTLGEPPLPFKFPSFVPEIMTMLNGKVASLNKS